MPPFQSRNDTKDYQWKVEASEAGEYLITLDVMNNKIKFIKK